MNIIIQPTQVPVYWEVIKHAAVKTNEIAPDEVHDYCVDLLCRLYSGKLRCMMSLNADRIISSIWLIEVVKANGSGKNHGIIHTLYAFEKRNMDEHLSACEALYKVFNADDCDVVYFETNNPRVLEITKHYGAERVSEKYVMRL